MASGRGRRRAIIKIVEMGSYRVSEGWVKSRRRERKHTMKLVLDDVMFVLEGMVLRWEWISGMKELIDSILHDWWPGLSSRAHAPLIVPRSHKITGHVHLPFSPTALPVMEAKL